MTRTAAELKAYAEGLEDAAKMAKAYHQSMSYEDTVSALGGSQYMNLESAIRALKHAAQSKSELRRLAVQAAPIAAPQESTSSASGMPVSGPAESAPRELPEEVRQWISDVCKSGNYSGYIHSDMTHAARLAYRTALAQHAELVRGLDALFQRCVGFQPGGYPTTDIDFRNALVNAWPEIRAALEGK